jgi:hypothetical protein
MNRLKAAMIALLVLALAPLARAQQVVSVETKWNEKTTAITTTSVSSLYFDVSGFGTTGYAILGGTYTANGVDGIPFGTLTAISTTNFNQLSSVGFDYTVLSLGSTAQFYISQTMKTPSAAGTNQKNPGGFNSPFPGGQYVPAVVFSSSAYITVPANTLYTHTFRGQVQNPIFNFNGLSKSATLYLQVDYGVPHLP